MKGEPLKQTHMDTIIEDREIFRQCINILSNNKAPGPDNIGNEILKHLPVQMQQTIHDMMILMWRTTLTPTRWKQLNTVLLYKKGDKTDIRNYRPVGLANTICKLWTRILTVAISRTCE